MELPAPKLEVSLIPLFIWIFMASSGITGEPMNGKTISFQIINKCDCTIWPASAPNVGHPVIAEGGFVLHPGNSEHIKAPSGWSGRFWARTGCNFKSLRPSCQTGDCQGLLSCNGTTGVPPATLVEVTLQPIKKGPSFYDISLVDGYNLPVSMSTKPANSTCLIKGCTESVNNVCPKTLQVLSRKGHMIACKSACLAFDSDKYCCRNQNGSAESCEASNYSKIFKKACPSYVSYAFDTPKPLVQCSSKEYVITFCPSKKTLSQSMCRASEESKFSDILEIFNDLVALIKSLFYLK